MSLSIARYPKRLIEVDLPIKRISEHARREKSIRHGHISTLHIWWARRPLAACRAVICAALWPDPPDELCPQALRDRAVEIIQHFAKKIISTVAGRESCNPETAAKWLALSRDGNALDPRNAAHLNVLRNLLLDFIADFANWDNSTQPDYLETSRALTQAAHEALGGEPGTRPLVVDPFAGGGSIPLEALRVGADAFASDLNPIPVLLNKVVLEYIPKYGQRLADEVREWGKWIKEQAERELAEFYPKDPDGATPIAYLWARTIRCEGPGCGTDVPLIRSLWLAKKANRSVALQLVPNLKAKYVRFQIIVKQPGGWVNQADHKEKIPNPKFDGTVKRGSATCPCCGYTTSAENVKKHFKGRRGGARDAVLIAIVTISRDEAGRNYRLPTPSDKTSYAKSEVALQMTLQGDNSFILPNEPLPYLRSIFNIHLLDVNAWSDLFTFRQSNTLVTLQRLVLQLGRVEKGDLDFERAVVSCIALAVGRQTNALTSLCRWNVVGEKIEGTFARQALGIVWDFCEANPFSGASGGLEGAFEWVVKVCEANQHLQVAPGHSVQASATNHPLPDDSAHLLFTDPPYYDAVPYADLSDFFYVWLKRMLKDKHDDLFSSSLTPKEDEVVQLAERNKAYAYKTKQRFEQLMAEALRHARRFVEPPGIGCVVFAHKATDAWEVQLQALIDAGWIVTASWPIDTEMGSRLRAMNSAALASSVHLVCRPRENPEEAMRAYEVGEWDEVLQELPRRIHEWMPRLAAEGVVGADAIFACLGPALEVFSRYSRVEKASGEAVTLKEYLEHVWAAVSKEALNMIFAGGDATGFEPDARLTAMWLWTLAAGANGNGKKPTAVEEEAEEAEDEDEEGEGKSAKKAKPTGFTLEYDAARKIAQGLGAHLEQMEHVAEIKGSTARLLSVAERTRHLFGKDEAQTPTTRRKKEKMAQTDMFEAIKSGEDDDGGGWGEKTAPKPGATTLDRVHQSMILFAAGRSDALKRFVIEEGAGRDPRFWKLAQALSALYPKETDEKRWVDGVLARKKGLGF